MAIQGAVRPVLIHTGKSWICLCPAHTREVFSGRSMYEAFGKLIGYLANDLGLTVDARWDDRTRSVFSPSSMSLQSALQVLRDAPIGRQYTAARLIKQLQAAIG